MSKVVEEQKPVKTAMQLLQEFLVENNIVLIQGVGERDIRTISDGSIIVGKPTIRAEFQK